MDFSNIDVLVIGDVCLDIFKEGIATRISPEAPVPIIENPTSNISLGMAGNVALNLKSLGANVFYNFLVGDDVYGKIFQNILFKEVSGNKLLFFEFDCATIVKERIIANNQQIARIDYEEKVGKKFVEKGLIDRLKKSYLSGVKYDLIIVSDYNKGIITEYTWPLIRKYLLKLSDNIFVDTKKPNVLDFYKGMHIFPNREEMKKIISYYNFNSPNELRKEMDSKFIVETASQDGAIIFEEHNIIISETYPAEVVDITGAGDTFISSFALAYNKFGNLKYAAKFANYCCSKVIQKKGTTPVLLSEISNFFNGGFYNE